MMTKKDRHEDGQSYHWKNQNELLSKLQILL